ncbi:hypothetical protein EJ02DRAFT_502786 [Clathrospora elynae]|uniref:Transcription factor IIIC putative zinc-finger domain-containing protein n=1 Tax=Clathrospora elynae TaxID=706981 RepID=A0A6A5SSH0_9PLEO|nr:hypothetical protein EJ02DRAFT_502786 [Clathrospora elynae]
MADVTVLRCWPACLDAIDWSPDGIIALASDERIELLFPNTVDFDRDQDIPQWQHVALKAPLFSIDELPLKEPASLQTYSVGEEISNSAVINIAWSPPGLAKHRRCALATHTANLVLSIWSAEGKPQDQSNWGRRLIVNHALAEYFEGLDDEPSHLTMPSKDRLRLRSRIRAFAWAPALPSSGSAGIVGTRLLYGQHIVAVANEDNHLVFVVIESPTSTLGVARGWSAEVLSHDTFVPDSESIFSESTFFEDMMKQQRYISHIAWSPWIVQGDWYHSVVVYATNEDVRARVITYAHDSIGLGEEMVYTGYELRYYGPMKWSPKVEEGDKLKLALFTQSGLVYLTISAHDASIIEQARHDLDGRWDQISGVVWDTAQESSPRLHFSSLLSTLQSPTAVLDLSSKELTSLGAPSWREQIENNLALFSVKNGLKGNSKAKVWGLTSSPLGDFIAACNSVHPSDMIEYGIPADRRGTVAISSLRHSNQQRETFPRENVTAEGVVYTLKKLAENTVEDPDKLPAFAEEMVEKLFETYAAPASYEDNASISTAYSDADDIESLIEAFKKVAFLDEHTLRDRYTILVSRACKTGLTIDLPKTLISYRLATALQSLPSTLSQTSFSAEILVQHQQLIALINKLTESEIIDAEPSAGQNGTSHDNTPGGNSDTNGIAPLTDSCDFCSAPIPFTDLTSAACTNGHQFPRCGLSFLTIQSPGITKYCGICSTPFLSDEFVILQECEDQKKSTEGQRDAIMTGVFQNGDNPEGGDHGRTNGVNRQNGDADGEGDAYQERIEEEQAYINGTNGDQSNSDTNAELDDEDDRRELPDTLARVLFLACDACIYCSGKFVG